MDYNRLYEYRFHNHPAEARSEVWREIATYLYKEMGEPRKILDAGAGHCEFINAVPAQERWAVDLSFERLLSAEKEVRTLTGDVFGCSLPETYFDAVFVSNFLEHLRSLEDVHKFLEKMHRVLVPGGQITIMGPNFRHCMKTYFDAADHTLALTDISVREHLAWADFKVVKSIGKFLPFSFRGRLPANRILARYYLRCPPIWRVMGKQFLVIGAKTKKDPSLHFA